MHNSCGTLTLFSLIFLVFCCCCLVSGKIFSDQHALLEIKQSLSDPNGLLSNWGIEGFNHCLWSGIQCNPAYRVVSIEVSGDGRRGNDSLSPPCANYASFPFYGFGIRKNLSGRNGRLGGTLSPVIGNLTELRVLSLPFNELGGEIPSEIWGLRNLEVLDLEGNSISGFLPGEFKGLRKLRVLNLGLNRIGGGIPASFSKCGGLMILNFAGNELNGTIPRFVGSFPRLKGLYLSSNRLNGPLPDVFGNSCWHLEHVDVSGNFINGEIPRGLGKCSRLRTLLLFSNLFSGVIPRELGSLRSLEVLDVSRNNLRGRVPGLENCFNLSVLVLSNLFDASNTRGDESVGLPSSATDEYNYFEGSFLMKLTMLPNLKIVWAPNVNLEGKFPSNWTRCENLEMVNLAQNLFKGEISGAFGACKNLQFLNLSSNRLRGQLDEKLPIPCMVIFDVSRNLISGSIPSFNSTGCSHITPIPSLDSDTTLSYNPLFAYLSFFMYRTLSEYSFPSMDVNLQMIHNFAGNKFTGPIPLLPIAPERLETEINYVFLAGGNKLSGPFFGGLSRKCDTLAGMVVNVSDNRIHDHFPSEFGLSCPSLMVLDASNNHISGSIPQSIGDLKSLVLLDLSMNKLSGSIPRGLVNLRNLTVLLLNNNTLSGHIPTGLLDLPSLTTFNVSFNNLSGPVKFNGHMIDCSSLLGNPLLPSCPTVFLAVPPPNLHAASPSGSVSESGLSSVQLASIIAASIIAVILLALVVLCYYVRKWISESNVQVSELSDTGEITVFNDIGVPLTYENLVQATGNFNSSNCIGNGGFGSTYKAEISPGTLLAVKRLTVERCQGIPQFHAETNTLGRISHPNLITLIGYHASEAEMFLIYNYLPGGNLKKFIQERERRTVGWEILHKISLDVASALAYLHDRCNPRIIHRDVKPSNILLDDDLNAYLSDFGLSRLMGISQTHATTGVAGTYGYVAPEYALTGRVSEKADVYSYGVVLLELISDKRALDPSFSPHGNGFNIVSWACMLLQQGQVEDIFTAGLLDEDSHDGLVGMLQLAILCTGESPSTRPKMTRVVQQLKQLLPPSS